MRYMLLIYGAEAEQNATPEQQAAEMQKWDDYTKWLTDKGWMRGGEALHPTSEATTVRVRKGETLTTDGPFAETKEQLGGFYEVECQNLDQAIEAAARVPSVPTGSIEVRPIMEFDTPQK
ncbi:MAG: YciI family protein [Actinomycetota bacterium]